MTLATLLRTTSSLLAACLLETTSAQCGEQVLHLTGTQIVGITEISVSNYGVVDSNDTYCASTLPYFIGYQYATNSSGTGSYTFAFNPPVDSAVLNVSGMSQDVANSEEVWLFVNGAHYAIPEAGSPQACDAMAVLTPEGNIGACPNCSVSGWGGTVIPGPISTLTVLDTVLMGSPAGTLFSLFICAQHGNAVPDVSGLAGASPYPNPATTVTFIRLPDAARADVVLFDADGRSVRTDVNVQGDAVRVPTENLPDGIYVLRVKQGGTITTHRIVVAR